MLVALYSLAPAQAYEADIHFATTYVLARAVGWQEADALIIASANQGVDENQETVAALEVDTAPSRSLAGYLTSSLHQAEKNLRFHCFSNRGEPADRISADVLEVIADHLARVPAAGDDPRRTTTRLVALGTALHCQQDAHSHVGFGGSCGSYSGSCYGHTYQTFLDQVAFSLLERHYFNPDHPGVSAGLLEALQGTVEGLSAHRPKGLRRPVRHDELLALAEGLRASGLELPDDLRRDCNRLIAGQWLYEHLRARAQDLRTEAVEAVSPGIAGTCRNPSLASAPAVRIPDPRFPRLNADASPFLVRADGTYERIAGGTATVAMSRTDAASPAGLHAHGRTRGSRVQLSHWTHVLALPLVGRLALSSAARPSLKRTR